MTLHKSASPLQIKSAGPRDGLDEGTFTGYASVFGNVDSHGDIVQPGAFAKSLQRWAESGDSIPLLWGHDMADPFANIGHIISAEEDAHGLKVTAAFDLDNPTAVQVYKLVKGRRVRAMSFAYDVLDQEFKPGAKHLLELHIHEASIVPVGSNRLAGVETVKAAPADAISSADALNLKTRILAAKAGPRKDAPTMNTQTTNPLAEQRATALDEAQALMAKSNGGQLTPEDSQTVETLLKHVEDLDVRLKREADSAALLARLTRNGTGDTDSVTRPLGGHTAALSGVKTAAPSSLSGSKWATEAVKDMSRAGGAYGVKSILNGTVRPSLDVVQSLADEAPRLLTLVAQDVFPVNNGGGNSYSYLQQTVRDLNAAIVPDHGVKPLSEFEFAEVENRSHVVAHMTRAMPLRYLEDHSKLLTVLDYQLKAGIFERLEDRILNGTGGEDDFAGILTTEGVQHVEFAGDMLVSLRRARTRIETAHEKVTGVALHPNDEERLSLMRENLDGSGRFLVDGDVVTRIFGADVQAVVSSNVPEGQAIVGNWEAARLLTHQGAGALAATQAANENGQDMFERNEVRIRCEGRYAFELLRPRAFAVVDLKAKPAA